VEVRIIIILLHTMYNLTILICDCLLRTEEKLLARNLQEPNHLLLPFHLHRMLLLTQLGLPLLPSMLARWRMFQRKVLDCQIAPLKVPRR
jgi:hypothetical protein